MLVDELKVITDKVNRIDEISDSIIARIPEKVEYVAKQGGYSHSLIMADSEVNIRVAEVISEKVYKMYGIKSKICRNTDGDTFKLELSWY